MKNEFLTMLPFAASGGFTIGDANPLYILITTVLTALIEYLKYRNQKKQQQKQSK